MKPEFKIGDGVLINTEFLREVKATVTNMSPDGSYYSVALDDIIIQKSGKHVRRGKRRRQTLARLSFDLTLAPQPWQIELVGKSDRSNIFLEWDGTSPGFRQFASLEAILASREGNSDATKLAAFVSQTGAVVVKAPSYLTSKTNV